VSSLSFLTNFDQIIRGVISLSGLFFYLSIIAFFLFANAIIVEQRKAA
jgi:ABC-2 type transport system permease protein